MAAWRWSWATAPYAHIGRLPNLDNDARDMSAALRRLGFEVTTELDADRVELTEALRAFTRQSAGADVSLVFYAGHGIEMDGVNYLVPVDARLERDVDVRFDGLFCGRGRDPTLRLSTCSRPASKGLLHSGSEVGRGPSHPAHATAPCGPR